MNYMEQVAKMLNVEIDEEFKIEGYDDNIRFKFTKNAFMQSCGDGWWFSSNSIMNVLEGYKKLIKLPKSVLTDEEKEYLSYVFRPFKDEILHIYKSPSVYEGYEEITVVMTGCRYLAFPAFEKNTMYKGMLPNKKYMLDELGL